MSNSIVKTYPFYTAYSQLNDIYGLEIPEDLFEVMGLTAWERIGNKQYRMYRIRLHPERCDDGLGWYVKVPCNCDIIESITADFEDAQRTSPIMDFPSIYTLPNENFNEYMKFDVDSLYQSGRFVKYKLLGDRILINEPYPAINILYKGIYADEEGLPFLNIKEVEAIASYCAFTQMRKQSYIAKDANILKLSQVEEANWKRLCDAARVPQKLNQNEMDEILNARSNWDRKRYNLSFKPVK